MSVSIPDSVAHAALAVHVAKDARAAAWRITVEDQSYMVELETLRERVLEYGAKHRFHSVDADHVAEIALDDALRLVDMTALENEALLHNLGATLLKSGRSIDQMQQWLDQAAPHLAEPLPQAYVKVIASRVASLYDEEQSRAMRDLHDQEINDLISRAMKMIEDNRHDQQ